jgi:hypothetical protein
MSDHAQLRRDLQRLRHRHGLAEPLAWLEGSEHLEDARAARDLAQAAVSVREARRRLGEERRLGPARLARLEAELNGELAALSKRQDADDHEELTALLRALRDEERRWGRVTELNAEVERLERPAGAAVHEPSAQAPWWHGERGQAALRRQVCRDEPISPQVPQLALAEALREVALSVALAGRLSPREDAGWGQVAEAYRQLVRRRSRLQALELTTLLEELDAALTLTAALAGAFERGSGRELSSALDAAERLAEAKELALRGDTPDLSVLETEQRFDHAWERLLAEGTCDPHALSQAAAAREDLREASAAAFRLGLLGSAQERTELEEAKAGLSGILGETCADHERRQRLSARTWRDGLDRGAPAQRALVRCWRRTQDRDRAAGPRKDSLDDELARARTAIAERPGAGTDPAQLAAAWLRFWRLEERSRAIAELERGGGPTAYEQLQGPLSELLRDAAQARRLPGLASAYAKLDEARRTHDTAIAEALQHVLCARARLSGLTLVASERVRELRLVERIAPD